jgi:hypothetical protein
VNLRAIRRAVKSGAWVFQPGQVEAASAFQKKRLTEAIGMARMYLEGSLPVVVLAGSIGVTEERTAQIIRLGLKYSEEAGWLRPAGKERTPKRPALQS